MRKAASVSIISTALLVLLQGAVGTNITIDTLCSIMADTSVGDELARYAAVNTLMLKTYKVPCLDVNYTAMIEEMRNTTMANEVIAGKVGKTI